MRQLSLESKNNNTNRRVIPDLSQVLKPPPIPNNNSQNLTGKERLNTNNTNKSMNLSLITESQIPPEENLLYSFIIKKKGYIVPRISNVGNYIEKESSNTNNSPNYYKNVYSLIPRNILDDIMRERDISLTGDFNSKINQLAEYDEIMPDWIRSIYSTSITSLTDTKLYVYGSMNDVSFDNINNLKKRDLKDYILACIFFNRENKLTDHLVNTVNINILKILTIKLGMKSDMIKFISDDMIKDIVRSGNPNIIDINKINNIKKRYEKIINSRYLNLLSKLYKIVGNEENYLKIAKSESHPIESIILNLDNISCEEIIYSLGIIIPPSYHDKMRQYILENIISYAKILIRGNLTSIPIDVMKIMNLEDLRKNYLEKLTDIELFNIINMYVQYSSRKELVKNIVKCFQRNIFMFPNNKLQKEFFSRSNNRETIVGSDINDNNILMICYGNPLNYTTYELLDLIESFERETNIINFINPGNRENNKFTIKEMEELKLLLLWLHGYYPNNKEIYKLINIIDRGIIDVKDSIAFDNIARKQLNDINNINISDLIRQFLRQIFYTGMYARKWKGEGHPFPLASEMTRSTFKPDDNVIYNLGICYELLNKMGKIGEKFCLNLLTCEYNQNGELEYGNIIFNTTFERVVSGDLCIRIASSRFIGTGYHYLRSLFKETISGIDIKKIDQIS